MKTPQTMRNAFCFVLSADLPLFQLLTAFSWCSVCVAFQPLHQLIFHHQFTPADPQSWEVRAAQKVVCPALEICNASAICFASITSGMASNGSLLINSPFLHKKAAATISVSARSARLRAAKRTPRARPARSAANTRRSRSFLRANPRRIRSTPTPVRPDLWTFRTTLGTLLPSTMWSTRVS